MTPTNTDQRTTLNNMLNFMNQHDYRYSVRGFSVHVEILDSEGGVYIEVCNTMKDLRIALGY